MLLRARGVDINAYDKVAGAPDAADFKSRQNKSASKRKDKRVKGAANPGNGSGDTEEVEVDETPQFWIKVGGARSCCWNKTLSTKSQNNFDEYALANETDTSRPQGRGGTAVPHERENGHPPKLACACSYVLIHFL